VATTVNLAKKSDQRWCGDWKKKMPPLVTNQINPNPSTIYEKSQVKKDKKGTENESHEQEFWKRNCKIGRLRSVFCW